MARGTTHARSSKVLSTLRRSVRLLPILVAVVFVATTSAPSSADPNPIVVENQQAGTTSWQFTDYNKAEAHEIEGYASLTSVNKGGTINLMVSTSVNAQYNLDIYRMGWYPTGTNPDGTSCAPSCGGRLMRHVGPLSGFRQAACPTVTSSTNPDFGMIECNWTPSYSLSVPTTWTQGVYLVKLKRLDGTQLENYMTFVVRDDASTAPVLYSLDTNTWQAYNFWGGSGNNNLGINLYGRFNDVSLANVSGSRAYTVSFDRPYLVQGEIDGAGSFFTWDFPMVKWMESRGYDMTYVTNTEMQANPNLLLGHRVIVNTGHDEYYSDGMKTALTNGIAGGVNLAFFSANNIYSRVTWGSNSSGAALRRIHTSKGSLNDGTVEYRYLTPPQPENAILGVLQNGVATSRPFLVYDASNWMFAGTGLVNYVGNGQTNVITSGAGQNALAGLIGYEFDERAVNAPSLAPYVQYDPPGVQQVGHSFVPAADNGVNAWSDAVTYTAPSGATVFSAGTIQWSFAVDNGHATGFCSCDHNVASTIGRRITSNILDRLSAPSQAPSASLSPGSLGFGSRNVGTTSAAQTVTLANTGSAAMTVNSIAITGTNAGDFAQTNACPSTLAAGANCTISVTFTPTAAGARAANVSVADNAPGSPHTVTLSGTGVATAPAVTLAPTSLGFGQQPVGTSSSPQNVTLTNSGTAPLTINSIGVTGTSSGDYTQTNTCPISPSTLAVGANCTISVSFAPTASGSRVASVSVSDNAPGAPHTVALSGTGTVPGVALNPVSLTFGSQLVGTTSAGQNVTLTNSGAAPLLISSIGLAGAHSADFAQLSNCPLSPSTLAPGNSCTIAVTFTPTAAGARTASVSIADNAPGNPHSVTLSGTGVATAPAVTLAPTSLGFGQQQVGTPSAPQNVTLTNSGTAALAINSIGVAGTNPADFGQTNTCPISPSTLPAGASCTISVTFTPTAAGSRTAALSISDNAGGSPHAAGLSGTGTAPGVTLAPSSLTFGSQLVGTTSAGQSVTLTNSGAAPLLVSSVGVVGTNAGDFAQANTCPIAPSTLAAGASCTISVTFTPTGAGSRTASVSVADNAPGNPHTVALAGTGVAPAPAVALAPTSLDFGDQVLGTTSTAQDVTLTNSGTAPLTIGSVDVTGPDAGDFAQTNTCPLTPSTLAVGATCTISATFAPSVAGGRTASVSIADDAPGGPHTVALSGTGIAPAVTLAPAGIDFASQVIGTTSAAHDVTLTNSGTAPLTINSVGVTGPDAGDFEQTNTCPLAPSALAVGGTCTISARFTPNALGGRAASISIADDASGAPHSVALTGTGVTAAPAVTLSPTSLSFGQQPVGTSSSPQDVTLTNSGTTALTITSIGTDGTNAGDYSQTNTCPIAPSTLAAGASCTISATFGPTAAGTRSASLSIVDDAAGNPHTVALSGTGTVSGVTLTPDSLTFGNQLVGTSSAAQSSTLLNSGSAPLVISSIGVSGANPGDFLQLSNCPLSPSTLAPGASCTISATFSPTAAGTRTASVTITDNAPGSPHAVGLSGTGVAAAPAVTFAPTSLGFADRLVGTTSPAQNVTLTNSGTGPLTISSIGLTGANAGDFAQTNACPVAPSTLAAGASCTIAVTFRPTGSGARSASVSVNDNAPGAPHAVALSGNGLAPIAFDSNLGAKNENVTSANMTLTTTGVAAAQTRVFLFVNWNHTSRTLTSVSGGGLTWTVDVQVRDSGKYHGAIASASAPAGLTAGTVITATFSGSVSHGLISAASFSGIASTNPVDRTGTSTQKGVVAWSDSITTTNGNDLVLGWSGIDAVTTSTPGAPNIEIHDFANSAFDEAATSVYRIESAAGAKTVNGTWLSRAGSSANNTTVVAYRGF